MILSAVSPVYDDAGTAIGAVGIDITLDHMTDIMSGYKFSEDRPAQINTFVPFTACDIPAFP